MIIMKTTWDDIWERSGNAPFSSKFITEDVLECQYKCPLQAIGLYLKSKRNISLLEINNINQQKDNKYDIKVDFEFLRKLDIKSDEFEREIKSAGLITIISDNNVNKLLNKFHYQLKEGFFLYRNL